MPERYSHGLQDPPEFEGAEEATGLDLSAGCKIGVPLGPALGTEGRSLGLSLGRCVGPAEGGLDDGQDYPNGASLMLNG